MLLQPSVICCFKSLMKFCRVKNSIRRHTWRTGRPQNVRFLCKSFQKINVYAGNLGDNIMAHIFLIKHLSANYYLTMNACLDVINPIITKAVENFPEDQFIFEHPSLSLQRRYHIFTLLELSKSIDREAGYIFRMVNPFSKSGT